MSRPNFKHARTSLDRKPTPANGLTVQKRGSARIADCKKSVMPIQYEKHDAERKTTARDLIIALGVIGVAVASGFAIIGAARRLRQSDPEDLTDDPADEQAITLKAPLEIVEAAWVEWCVGEGTLGRNYAVRFEPAPGARGTEVRVVSGRPAGSVREELRKFKQRLETGEIPISDGPGLSRPAQPRRADAAKKLAEVPR
jgi:hypothetical protein